MMLDAEPIRATKADAIAALTAAAFHVGESDGIHPTIDHKIVHTFTTHNIGADWELDAAIDWINEANEEQVWWRPHILSHELVAMNEGRVIFFDCQYSKHHQTQESTTMTTDTRSIAERALMHLVDKQGEVFTAADIADALDTAANGTSSALSREYNRGEGAWAHVFRDDKRPAHYWYDSDTTRITGTVEHTTSDEVMTVLAVLNGVALLRDTSNNLWTARPLEELP